MNRQPQLVEIKTSDSLALPGLLFEPANKSRKAAILLHGNGSSSVFYSQQKSMDTAQALNRRGIAYLAFNNRGAHYYHKLKFVKKGKRVDVMAGTAFELIKDCVKDIDAAIAFLKKHGYREFCLIGHSTGANKICVYNYYKRNNPVSKYVLAAGGDDSGIYYNSLGKKKFFEALSLCKKKVKQGKGKELVPSFVLPMPYSYQAFLDIMDPDGDYNIFPFWDALNGLGLAKKRLFREYASVSKKTLVIYGEKDDFCYGRTGEIMRILENECRHPEKFTFAMIPEADHGFTGKENQFNDFVASWLSES